MSTEENLYQTAEQKNSWYSLVSFPYLLFRWQVKHPKDIPIIAKLVSHKLGKHRWCTASDDCMKIDRFIMEHSWEAI